MKKSLLALIMIFAMVVGNVGTVYAEEPSEGQPAVQEQVDLTVSESTPEITEAPSADFEREDLTGSGELIPEIPEENISEPDEAQAGVEGVSIPKDENVSLEIAETETQPAGEDTETETELIQTPTAIVAEDDPEEEIEAVQPFDYNGDSIAFIKEDGSGFGMYAAQDGTTAVLSENEVKITYLPKSTTVYLGFYYGDIRLSDDWVDYIELKDDKFEFTVSREKCGKAWPVAPVKADGISTTSTQYYLAIPSEDKLEKEEEPALNIVPITLTDEMPVILTGTPVYYSFTPEESGLYFLNLYSKYEDFGEQYKGMLDGAYYELLDDSMNYINASQDSMAAELQAGRTYYYRAYNYYGDYEISGYLELRKEQTVTITYVTDNNGYFDEDPESRSKQCNVAINQSVDGVWPTPFNDDVRFAGWASSPDATEPEYIEADCEKTVYAVWHQQFKVTFHVNNPDAYYEEWDDTIDDYIHSDVTIDLLPKGYIIYGSEWYYVPAFPENIIFAGWSENPFATEADEEIVINGDKDLYTVWKTAYPVTFYSNDGENAYFAGRDYDEEGNLVIIKEASWRADYQEGTLLQDLLFNELTNDNEGKVFGGWGLTADASEPADVTLDGSFTEVYAIWVPGATVTYHVNNDDIDAYYSVWEGEYEQYLKEWTGKYALGTIITKEDQIPEGDWEWSDNVFFAGWSTNPDADFAGDIEITSTDKKDLYAVWRERKEDNNLTAYVADVDYETQDWWTSSEIGETLSFGVVADADDPSCITYQWYKREWKEDDWKPISGAVGSTFETGPLTTRTFYYCRVDDGFGNSVVINYYVYIE
ncbi:MAG: hypothetical protein IKF90_04075, partial [Parasporobacterium sp.]|nr:hypothetical protein [Parasporobacterium sp.]